MKKPDNKIGKFIEKITEIQRQKEEKGLSEKDLRLKYLWLKIPIELIHPID